MLKISTNVTAQLQNDRNERWVQLHVMRLSELAPAFAAMYTKSDFTALVTRMLHRAELSHLTDQDSSIAFCYASIKLGIGFEDKTEHSWFAQAKNGPKGQWADAIWTGLRQNLRNSGQATFGGSSQ